MDHIILDRKPDLVAKQEKNLPLNGFAVSADDKMK